MRKNNLPTTFTSFQWGLAMFCLPILLWPLALLISPNLLKNPTLTDLEIRSMSIFFWIYPLILSIVARISYKLHQYNKPFSKILLIISTVIFYGVLYYIAVVGLN